MRPLTARQQEVLELLKRHLETTGMPPTRAEISRELGFKSPNAAEERVAAGEPILAEQHIEGTYRVDANMFKPQADFLLKVYGQSMKDIGILDGDLLAVHSTKDVRNGQIVVARIEDEVTVKRLERKGSVIYLHAENEEFQPIVVNLEEQPHFEIEGIAVGIIRNNAWM